MITPQLLDFVRGRIASGVSRDEIRRQLLVTGWDQDDVSRVFETIDTALPTPPEAPAAPLAPPVSAPLTPPAEPAQPIQPVQTVSSEIPSPRPATTPPPLSAGIVRPAPQPQAAPAQMPPPIPGIVIPPTARSFIPRSAVGVARTEASPKPRTGFGRRLFVFLLSVVVIIALGAGGVFAAQTLHVFTISIPNITIGSWSSADLIGGTPVAETPAAPVPIQNIPTTTPVTQGTTTGSESTTSVSYGQQNSVPKQPADTQNYYLANTTAARAKVTCGQYKYPQLDAIAAQYSIAVTPEVVANSGTTYVCGAWLTWKGEAPTGQACQQKFAAVEESINSAIGRTIPVSTAALYCHR